MRILAIEKTEDALKTLEQQIYIAFPGSCCEGFSDPLLAIKSFLVLPPDFTIFCKDMRIIDGFTFARTLRNRYMNFTGVMLADDDSSKTDAQKYFLEYLVRPVDALQLRQSWDRIHAPLDNAK